MKSIYKIAWVELQILFYSPIAWIILIIFTFQCGTVLIPIFQNFSNTQEMGYGLWGVTEQTFGGIRGFFTNIQQYLYLYIPLITMSLLSREYSSGSIKLLYSSPISNSQIIFGKYLAMMIYAFVLIIILSTFSMMAIIVIENVNIYVIISGLLGLYLLVCAYASIGLFMSGLTNYQVVAAMGTLVILAVLNIIGDLWQDKDIMRDITYWLSIKGRADEMISGLICSEDILYFLIIITFFLSLSLIRIKAKRQKLPAIQTSASYITAVALMITLGYITSRPQFMSFHDTTKTKALTLTPNSQEILSRLEDNLTITTYVNLLDSDCIYGLPYFINTDLRFFKQYLRFKPRIKMKYVYYYDSIHNPELEKRYPGLSDRERMIRVAETNKLDTNKVKTPEEIRKIIDLKPEGNRLVRLLERQNGQKTFLRYFDDMMKFANEAEISAAFKRLLMPLPKVGFLHGHGERDCYKPGDKNYSLFTEEKSFRHSLINNGFDFQLIDLNNPIPDDIKIIVIADIQEPLSTQEKENLNNYIENGGNLLITGEPQNREILNPIIQQFGVQLEGILVRQSEDYEPDFIIGHPTEQSTEIAYSFKDMKNWRQKVTMPGCGTFKYNNESKYQIIPLITTDSTGCWLKENFKNNILDTLIINPDAGETEKPYTTMLALNRQVEQKHQKIIIIADADCISNSELNTSRPNLYTMNYSLVAGSFFWLSDGEVPIDISRPTPLDNKVHLTTDSIKKWRILYMILFPLTLLLITIYIYIKRKGR